MCFKAFIRLIDTEPKRERGQRQDFPKCGVDFGLRPRAQNLPMS